MQIGHGVSRATNTPPRCPLCRYDLTGIDAIVCPECGGSCDQESREIAPRRGRLNRTLTCAAILVAPLLFFEGLVLAMYAKSWMVYGLEADHALAAIAVYFALPTLVGAYFVAAGVRASRDRYADATQLDRHWDDSGIALFVIVIMGWALPAVLALMALY